MTPKARSWAVVLSLSVAGLAVACGGSSGSGTANNTPPTLTDSVQGKLVVRPGEVVEFTLFGGDADFDKLDVRLLNPQPGMAVAPVLGQIAPAVMRVRWLVPLRDQQISVPLLFTVNESATPGSVVTHTIDVRWRDSLADGTLIGDVTGDGKADVVTLSVEDVNAGAIYVWSGTPSPTGSVVETARLSVPSELIRDGRPPVHLADLDGDGTLDILVSKAGGSHPGDVGAIFVWHGGSTLIVQPTYDVQLSDPNAVAWDTLGQSIGSYGHAIVVKDVTGDGRADVIALASGNWGRKLLVWAGSLTFFNTPNPPAVAELTSPSGWMGALSGEGLLVEDVTGDGVRDVIAFNEFATVATLTDAGEAYLWRGGASLTGTLAPHTLLRRVSPAQADHFAGANGGPVDHGIQLSDVTGDGVLDVIASVPFADAAAPDSGVICVWPGGPALNSGTPAPVEFSDPLANPSDLLGSGTSGSSLPGRGSSVLTADVTGDGILDVIGVAPRADFMGVDTGAIHVWKGGAVLTPSPSFSLGTSAAVYLGSGYGGAGTDVFFGDVTGDGILDIVANANDTLGGPTLTGGVFVWRGGSTIATAPLVTLLKPNLAAGDGLFAAGLADVTGDGVLDVVANSQGANTQPLGLATGPSAGAIYVWNIVTASGLTPSPLAELMVSGATGNDRLGYGSTRGVLLADVTRDGTVDVLGSAPVATIAGQGGAGSVYVWPGSATLAGAPVLPAVSLVSATPTFNGTFGGAGPHVCDVTGDGNPDIVVPDRATSSMVVWAGATVLTPLPARTVTAAGEPIGSGTGQTFLFVDVTNDGVRDLLAVASGSTRGGQPQAGCVFFWLGAGSSTAPDAVFDSSAPQAQGSIGQ